MAKEHSVKQGECISSIAFEYGFFPDTIWQDASNTQLRGRRQNPNVLFEGDIVVIPNKRLRHESGESGKRHRFRRKGVPELFTLLLHEGGQPRANQRYVLTIDGTSREGETDNNGMLTEPIPSNASVGRLVIGEDEEELWIEFGDIDPITELSGVQSRLTNLGYYDGPINGQESDDLRDAIAEFQTEVNIQADGQLTDDTRDALLKGHWS